MRRIAVYEAIAPLPDAGVKMFDARAFRQCLAHYATGVTVITTAVDGERAGIAANSFSSLSLDPPLVLWSLGRASRSASAFRRSTHFAVNVLSHAQLPVAEAFSSRSTDKFAGFQWLPGEGGLPLLAGSVATLECKVERMLEAGDHVLFIGEVLRFRREDDASPLIFVQGRYTIAEGATR